MILMIQEGRTMVKPHILVDLAPCVLLSLLRESLPITKVCMSDVLTNTDNGAVFMFNTSQHDLVNKMEFNSFFGKYVCMAVGLNMISEEGWCILLDF